MEEVKLRNGTREVKVLVVVGLISLRSLMETNPIAFYELVCKARDSQHVLFGNTLEVLRKFSLVEADGSIHDSMRNIILSSVEGEELEMHLVNPIVEFPQCPCCGGELYYGGRRNYETLSEHVINPNADVLNLRQTLICVNTTCIAFNNGYWGVCGGEWYSNFMFPEIPSLDSLVVRGLDW